MRQTALLFAATLALVATPAACPCSIFTLVRDGRVLMGNNEDYVQPGVIWFVPGKKGRYGRVNVGFDVEFAQGGMNEAGLAFDGTALAPVPWQPDPGKPTPDNLVDVIMNECATVAQAIEYFQRNNCRHLANGQLMFADASGDAAVVSWLPEIGLSVVRIEGDPLIVTNDRLEASGYRCQRYVRAEQILAETDDASIDTAVAVLDAVHQHGPGAFTTYSTVYDLKARRLYLYNLANFEEAVEFDLKEKLAKGTKVHLMKTLFEHSPALDDIKRREQRVSYDTRISLDPATLDAFTGTYSPVEAPDVRFKVERAGDELRVINPGQPDAYLFPESETSFRIEPDRGTVSFDVDDSGYVTGLTLHKARDLVAVRADP